MDLSSAISCGLMWSRASVHVPSSAVSTCTQPYCAHIADLHALKGKILTLRMYSMFWGKCSYGVVAHPPDLGGRCLDLACD